MLLLLLLLLQHFGSQRKLAQVAADCNATLSRQDHGWVVTACMGACRGH
jgi:hypothetical protein